jgi:hypothetical protein
VDVRRAFEALALGDSPHAIELSDETTVYVSLNRIFPSMALLGSTALEIDALPRSFPHLLIRSDGVANAVESWRAALAGRESTLVDSVARWGAWANGSIERADAIDVADAFPRAMALALQRHEGIVSVCSQLP